MGFSPSPKQMLPGACSVSAGHMYCVIVSCVGRIGKGWLESCGRPPDQGQESEDDSDAVLDTSPTLSPSLTTVPRSRVLQEVLLYVEPWSPLWLICV